MPATDAHAASYLASSLQACPRHLAMASWLVPAAWFAALQLAACASVAGMRIRRCPEPAMPGCASHVNDCQIYQLHLLLASWLVFLYYDS